MTKVALQLWSVQADCAVDFFGTLEKVARMGYDGVEFAGYYEHSAADLQEILKRLNLEVAGSHIPFEKLQSDFAGVVAYEKAIGNKNIVIPWINCETVSAWQEVFTELQTMQARLAKEGMTLIYHNHAHELLDFKAFNVLEQMKKNVPLIQFEVDTYWIDYAQFEVEQWLLDYQAEIALLHIKEMMGEGEERQSAELGKGHLAIENYVAFAKKQNLPWLIIEQEAFQNLTPLESAAYNVKQLKELL